MTIYMYRCPRANCNAHYVPWQSRASSSTCRICKSTGILAATTTQGKIR